jgi:hypothetical protein
MKRLLTAIGLACVFAALQPALGAGPGDQRAERISVHGHWTIDVLRPDGTLVERRDFHNALKPTGAMVLADILAGRLSPGRFSVVLAGGLCYGDVDCRIAESVPGAAVDPGSFSTLHLTLDATWTALTLSGTATTSRAGSIPAVTTRLGYCGKDVVPGDCEGFLGVVAFTEALVLPPLSVVAGQIVRVTVTLTFS